MATGWAEIVTAAMGVIDDERMREMLAASPAIFYRTMADYIRLSLPLLNRPPELLAYLNSELVQPQYDDYEWVSTDDSTSGEVTLETGLTGFTVCSVVQRVSDPAAGIIMTPYAGAVYDPETGNVTMPVQNAAGIDYEFDFYTDGSFADLSGSQMRLFALAVGMTWDQRFERTWLNIQAKIHDSSFEVVNEGNYMEKSSQRLQRNIAEFQDELRKYEQDVAYRNVVTPRRGKPTLV